VLKPNHREEKEGCRDWYAPRRMDDTKKRAQGVKKIVPQISSAAASHFSVLVDRLALPRVITTPTGRQGGLPDARKRETGKILTMPEFDTSAGPEYQVDG
jgi:hypothetical protein